jgi:hypothetical protein
MRYASLFVVIAIMAVPAPEAASAGRTAGTQARAMIDSVSLVRLSTDIRWLEEPGGHNSRVTFTPGNDSAVAYIYRSFLAIPGLTSVGLDTFFIAVDDTADSSYASKPLVNVVATLAGKTDPARSIVVGAHYDASASRMGSTTWNSQWRTIRAPGADDNASGVAATLEAARLVSDPSFGVPNDYTITFVAFGSEESGPAHDGGHGGSTHYAAQARARGDQILGMISVDMIAHNRHYTTTDIVSNAASVWLGQAFVDAKDSLDIPLITNTAPFTYATYSDHASFWNQGYDAILLIEHAPPWNSTPQYYANPFYHTSSDTIETLNYSLLKRATQTLVGTLVALSSTPTAVDQEAGPLFVRLDQNYPNPFNPDTRIRFTVGGDRAEAGGSPGSRERRTTLAVYDMLGRQVAVLVDEKKPAGSYEVVFRAGDLPTGVYVVRLTAGAAVESRRMLLLK